MTVHHLGWGASQDAIRAACAIGGWESEATRVRRKPIAIVEPDYAQEAIDARKLGRPKRVAPVIDLDEARARRAAVATSTTTIEGNRARESFTDGSLVPMTCGIKTPARRAEKRSLAIGVCGVSAFVTIDGNADVFEKAR
jgi:hypothetical protein